jgi:hypothetical protein
MGIFTWQLHLLVAVFWFTEMAYGFRWLRNACRLHLRGRLPPRASVPLLVSVTSQRNCVTFKQFFSFLFETFGIAFDGDSRLNPPPPNTHVTGLDEIWYRQFYAENCRENRISRSYVRFTMSCNQLNVRIRLRRKTPSSG